MPDGATEAVLGRFAILLAKIGLDRLLDGGAIEAAIADTTVHLTEVEAGPALAAWVGSDSFNEFVGQIEEGRRSILPSDITSFIAATGFYAPENKRELAASVLSTFLYALVSQLYQELGLTVAEQRQKYLHFEAEHAADRRQADVIDGIERIESQGIHLISMFESAEPRPGEEAFSARLDEARRLLREGRLSAAESILRPLDTELRQLQSHSHLRARIAVNIAACRIQFLDLVEAETYLTRALDLEPDFVKALNGLAQLELIRGDYDAAAMRSERSLECEPDNEDGQTMRLLALDGLDSPEVAPILADPEWGKESALQTLARGEVLLRRESFDEAQESFRRAIALNPDEPQAHILLAQAIFAPIQQSFRTRPPLPWRVSGAASDGLDAALRHMSEAIRLLEGREPPQRMRDARCQRGAMAAVAGRADEAVRDFDRVLAEDDRHPSALMNKGLWLLQQDRCEDALVLFRRAQEADPDREFTVLIALCELNIGRPAEARHLLEQVWQPSVDERSQIEVGALLMRACQREGLGARADEIEAAIAATWPGDPEALSAIADRHMSAGKLAEAADLLREALADSSNGANETIQLQLAEACMQLEQWADAADLYAPIADQTTNSPTMRSYCVAMFNAHMYAEVRAAASKLRALVGPVPVITEIEAQVEEYVGNLDKAVDLYLQLDKKSDGDPSYRILAATLCVQHGDRQRALDLVAGIDAHAVWEKPIPLMQLAQLRHELGLDEVMPLAYQARRRGIDNPDIHMAYLGLMLARESDVPAPEIAGVDTTVVLRHGDEQQIFTITDEPSASRDRGELRPDDILAVLIMGKKVGENVVAAEGDLGRVEYTIAEVKSKFVAANQETFLNFSIWFPKNTSLQRLDVSEGDFSKLFLALDHQDERNTQVVNLYVNGPFTIGAVASATGRTVIETWGEMTSRKDVHVKAAAGSIDDLRREVALLSSCDSIVLDITGLLAIAHLGIQDEMKRRYGRILVSQGVLGEVNRTLNVRFGLRRPAMTLGKEGDHYIRTEITEESYKRGKAFVQGMGDFIATACEIVPHEEVLGMDPERYEQLTKLLGVAATTTLLVAKGSQKIIFCDDQALKGIAAGEARMPTVSVQAILTDLQTRGLINVSQYSQAVGALMLARYRHLLVAVDDIVWALEEASMGISPTVIALFEAIRAPACSEDSAVGVVTGVLEKVWQKAIPLPTKMLVLDLALADLMQNRSSTRVADKLKTALSQRFAHAPQALRPIFETIDMRVELKTLGRIRSWEVA